MVSERLVLFLGTSRSWALRLELRVRFGDGTGVVAPRWNGVFGPKQSLAPGPRAMWTERRRGGNTARTHHAWSPHVFWGRILLRIVSDTPSSPVRDDLPALDMRIVCQERSRWNRISGGFFVPPYSTLQTHGGVATHGRDGHSLRPIG